jgi:hypothetical protein
VFAGTGVVPPGASRFPMVRFLRFLKAVRETTKKRRQKGDERDQEQTKHGMKKKQSTMNQRIRDKYENQGQKRKEKKYEPEEKNYDNYARDQREIYGRKEQRTEGRKKERKDERKKEEGRKERRKKEEERKKECAKH